MNADLNDEQSIIDACKDCTYVVHTASPFTLTKPKHEDELIKPAVNGTLAAMKGAKEHGVKRVVITSSVASIAVQDKKTDCTSLDETFWSKVELCPAYQKSKTLAEKAAWDFVEALPEGEKFELCTVCPSFIQGPSFTKSDSQSAEIFRDLLNGKTKATAKIQMSVIDVRDCAETHLRCITVPEAAGNRFISANESMWFSEMADVLREEFGDLYKIPNKEISKAAVWIGSWFDGRAAYALQKWNKPQHYSNKKAREVLG